MSVGSTATQRLKKDYSRLMNDPVPFVTAHPRSSNILEWHYVVTGPPGSPYEGGYYHGKLVFPTEYPFRPPAIYMITPNGRFNVNTRLCLSISDYHPDTWNPAWSVATILTGLLSFMLETTATLGSVETTDAEKRAFARRSLEVNLKNKIFCDVFPDLATELREKQVALERQRSLATTTALNSQPSIEDGAAGGASAVSSLLVVVGVVCFAFAARWVLMSAA